MPKFRIVKTRINSTDALVAATSIASIVANVADMTQFIPARAAASVVLVILQTVQEIDNNRVACYKLARRSAKILVDLKVRMAGRWDTAPEALVENIQEYERVLVVIRDFMLELRKVGWMGRLLKKGSIEESLSDFHDLLDEAERTFQIASLVEIHYTVGILEKRGAGMNLEYVDKATNESGSEDGTAKLTSIPSDVHHSSEQKNTHLNPSLPPNEDPSFEDNSIQKTREEISRAKTGDDAEELVFQRELEELEHLGFKRYHRADLRLLSEAKSGKSGPFWQQTMVAEASGTRVLVKHYDDGGVDDKDNLRRWLHDIKMLRNLYHPNLPQLTGYSDEKTTVPFILLGQAKLRDPNAYLLSALRSMSISECAIATLKISAALYVQRQLSFDERETQVFVAEASYAFDTESGNVIVGVPPPKENHFHGFGYPLTESLLGTTMQLLPGDKNLTRGDSPDIVDLQDKLAHIKALARILLPSFDQKPQLTNASEALLEDAELDRGEKSMPLSRIRAQSIDAGTHEFAWYTGIHSCPISFTVGDIGYISRDSGRVALTDKSRFDNFVKLGNLIDDLVEHDNEAVVPDSLSLIREVTGTQGQWINGFRQTNEVWPFVLPDNCEGWPISLSAGVEVEIHVRHSARMASVSEAWRCLLKQAEHRAIKAGIDPHEVILNRLGSNLQSARLESRKTRVIQPARADGSWAFPVSSWIQSPSATATAAHSVPPHVVSKRFRPIPGRQPRRMRPFSRTT